MCFSCVYIQIWSLHNLFCIKLFCNIHFLYINARWLPVAREKMAPKQNVHDLICNAYKYCLKESQRGKHIHSICRVEERVCAMLGICKSTLYQHIKQTFEESQPHGGHGDGPPPKKRKRVKMSCLFKKWQEIKIISYILIWILLKVTKYLWQVSENYR